MCILLTYLIKSIFMKNLLICALLLVCLGGCKISKVILAGQLSSENFFKEIPTTSWSNLMVVEMKVGDRTGKYMYDTGAMTVIKRSVVEELGLKRAASSSVGSSNSIRQQMDFVVLPTVEIEGILFEDIGAAVVEDSNLNKSPEMSCLLGEMDGILGSNLMRLAHWQLDFEKEVIRMTDDPSRFAPTASSIIVPIKVSAQGRISMRGHIGAGLSGNFILDTGSNGHFTLANSLFQKLLNKRPQTPYNYQVGQSSAGLFGRARDTTYIARLDSFRFGDLVLDSALVRTSGGNNYLMGNAFMKQFLMTFDWDAKQVIFTPYEEFKVNNTMKTFGFSPAYHIADKRLYVGSLHRGGAAEQAGMAIDQQIISVNGNDYDPMSLQDYCTLLMDGLVPKTDTVVEIVVKEDNGQRKITLQKEQWFP